MTQPHFHRYPIKPLRRLAERRSPDLAGGRFGASPASRDETPALRSGPDTVEIPLSRGLVTLVDAEDVPLASSRRWYAHRSQSGWYARSGGGRLHRILLGVEPGQQVDHRNGDGLDNRRANLRVATRSENAANRGLRSTAALPFKGVKPESNGRYRARITVDGIRTSLGTFPSPELAARAYDVAALEAFGGFARLNFPLRASAELSPIAGVPPVHGRSGEDGSADVPRGSSAGPGD